MTIPRNVLFGAAYYHEYQPYERLGEDFQLMMRASFSLVRVGESVWSTWEPSEGEFDLDWLQPVLDEAHSHGISVIIGTPTYAVPPWLRTRYPETTAERRSGQANPLWPPSRRRFYAPRVQVSRRTGDQKDRSPLPGPSALSSVGSLIMSRATSCSTTTRCSFGSSEHLMDKYGTVDALNERWGLTYWSHRIADWGELWVPDGNTVPAYDLEWRRYQAELTTEFVNWQADIVRGIALGHHFVTTCIALSRPAMDATALARRLDVTATNLYYPMQGSLAMPSPQEAQAGQRPQWLTSYGTWRLYELADMSRGVRQEPFLVTETNARAVADAHVNYPAFPGQWRQAAWALVARGARAVEYWHWHTLHFGHETFWGGVLGHSLEPGRCYQEIAEIGKELATTAGSLSGYEADAEVMMLFSAESKWAFEFQPPLTVEGTAQPDPRSYERVFDSFYRGLFEAGVQVGICSPEQLPEDPHELLALSRVIVVPAFYIAPEPVLDLLRDYAELGGHVVLGFKSGYADEDARPRPTLMPGSLRKAVGAFYDEFTNVPNAVPVTGESGFVCDEGAGATAWAEGLVPEGATVLARYDHPFYGQWPAIVTNEFGDGRITYVGTLPNAPLGLSLGRWIRETSLSQRSLGGTAGVGQHHERSYHKWLTPVVPQPLGLGQGSGDGAVRPSRHVVG